MRRLVSKFAGNQRRTLTRRFASSLLRSLNSVLLTSLGASLASKLNASLVSPLASKLNSFLTPMLAAKLPSSSLPSLNLTLSLFLLRRPAPRRPLPLVFRQSIIAQLADNTSVMLCSLLSPNRHFVYWYSDCRLPPGNRSLAASPHAALGCLTRSSLVVYPSVTSSSKPSTG